MDFTARLVPNLYIHTISRLFQTLGPCLRDHVNSSTATVALVADRTQDYQQTVLFIYLK